jgi:hypothetical protein
MNRIVEGAFCCTFVMSSMNDFVKKWLVPTTVMIDYSNQQVDEFA